MLTLRAVLLDGNRDVVNDAEQKLTVFQDVSVVPNDNVVILKLEPGLHTVAGETVTVKPLRDASAALRLPQNGASGCRGIQGAGLLLLV